MSMDWWEAEQEAGYEQFVESLAKELYTEHREQAIQEFVSERLKSYYKEHNDIAVGSLLFLRKAKELRESEPTSSLLLSSTATEVILKSVLLKPVVFGLVHTDSLAELVANMLVRQAGIDRFKELVFKVLEHHIDFGSGVSTYCRKDSNQPLWSERAHVQEIRNRISHRAEFCTDKDARLSLDVGTTFFMLTKLLIENIGYKMNKEGLIASE